ncbi:ABC transporter ATP-binding protein [Methanomassiliicoccus luminyensis]|jgi:ABC-type Fe3+/spermidine/putrescine transport system ATPase subunit|uniref:ABC transporter ATP-binding protein n=1 Tax=Methanomassiliicoccus luminyensis TaxID=1080712 RepID=UPI000365E12B|nr:ABC transporter ATP-binding protein [Methanomassiliicoccus luminyensis]
MSFLELKDISKRYKNAPSATLDGLGLSLHEGEIMVILGPSGCGKSTTLKIIAGLEEQDSGSVLIDGERMDGVKTEKRPIAMVFQKPLLFRHMTVGQNVDLALRVTSRYRKEELAAKTAEMLRLVKLEGFEDRRSTEISGGQEQRVSLARALMTSPKLLLLDEPLSALDAELRIEMRKNIREICKSLNLTVLFVTHDQQEAVSIADRIGLLIDGKIVQCGEPEEFYCRPASAKVAKFFGWKNFIPARQEGTSVTSSIGTFDIEGLPNRTGDAILLIRPEGLLCSDHGAFSAKVRSVSYLGARSEYVIDHNGTDLNIAVSTRFIYQPGDELRFDLDTKMMWAVEPEPAADKVTAPVIESRASVLGSFKGLISRKRSVE